MRRLVRASSTSEDEEEGSSLRCFSENTELRRLMTSVVSGKSSVLYCLLVPEVSHGRNGHRSRSREDEPNSLFATLLEYREAFSRILKKLSIVW